jgi:hypothetical protein
MEFAGRSFQNLTLRLNQRWQASSRSLYWHERDHKTFTLCKVSDRTGWWNPSYRCLTGHRHRHDAQQSAPHARPRSPTIEDKDLQTRPSKDGSSSSVIIGQDSGLQPRSEATQSAHTVGHDRRTQLGVYLWRQRQSAASKRDPRATPNRDLQTTYCDIYSQFLCQRMFVELV